MCNHCTPCCITHDGKMIVIFQTVEQLNILKDSAIFETFKKPKPCSCGRLQGLSFACLINNKYILPHPQCSTEQSDTSMLKKFSHMMFEAPWNSLVRNMWKSSVQNRNQRVIVIFNKRLLWVNVASSARLYLVFLCESWSHENCIQTHTCTETEIQAFVSIDKLKYSLIYTHTHTELYIDIIYIYFACYSVPLLYDLPSRHPPQTAVMTFLNTWSNRVAVVMNLGRGQK